MYVSYMLRYMRKYHVAVWKFRSVYIFGDVSVAQLVVSMSGEVLGGVVEVVGSNLARGKFLHHLLAQLIHYIPPYLSTV